MDKKLCTYLDTRNVFVTRELNELGIFVGTSNIFSDTQYLLIRYNTRKYLIKILF